MRQHYSNLRLVRLRPGLALQVKGEWFIESSSASYWKLMAQAQAALREAQAADPDSRWELQTRADQGGWQKLAED